MLKIESTFVPMYLRLPKVYVKILALKSILYTPLGQGLMIGVGLVRL